MPNDSVLDHDPRWDAFRASHGAEVFHSVVSPRDVWKADSFDVEEIHAEARDVFAGILERAAAITPDDLKNRTDLGGKILLLRGESGAGKTHLMRAFRHRTHSQRLGWFAYLQMTSNAANYYRYVLRNVIVSLSEPYDLEGGVAESGLKRLSDALALHPAVPADLLAELRDGDQVDVPQLVMSIAEHLLVKADFVRAEVDLNVLRALLFLQRCEPALTSRVASYLRCDAMSSYDSELIGDIPPRPGEDEPALMLAQLGRLMALAAPTGGAFVLCIDQLEDGWRPGEEARTRFANAINALREISEPNPAAVVVISCLDDYWVKLREGLLRPLRDRIEEEAPKPVVLRTRRELAEVEALIARRLQYLYEDGGIAFQPEQPVFPFAPAEVAELTPMRVRDILLRCREARERSVLTGARPRLVEEAPLPPVPDLQPGSDDGVANTRLPIIAPPDPEALGQGVEMRWNDFRSAFDEKPAESDPALAELLAWAIGEFAAELDGREGFAAEVQRGFVVIGAPAALSAAAALPPRWLLALCNGRAQGGRLSRQIGDLASAARESERAAVAVRTTTFPGSPKTKIAQQIGELIKTGGRRVVIEDADWRALHALREFLKEESAPTATGDSAAALAAWRTAEKPLTRLAGLRELLLLDKLPPAPVVAPAAPVPPVPDPLPGLAEPPSGAQGASGAAPSPVSSEAGPLHLGATRESAPKPVLVPPDDLTRHAAFLGGSGSGKTTLALAMIEELLLRGVPAILLDRKGDLACYARPESWTAPLTSPSHDADAGARRERLRARLDVQLFTPGDAAAGRGRPLGISLLPRGAGGLPAPERETVARAAAASLGAMMKYAAAGATAPRLAVLGKAIGVLAEIEPDADLTLDRLSAFIDEEDAALVSAVGRLETRLFKKVVQDLETFRLNQGHLLAAGPDEARVDAERLFGLGAHAPGEGKTRLSIISTKFFSDTAGALFWIAQFLLEISRFAARQPSDKLQGAVLFDEADLYLPAVGRTPPTKEPMENALRRWRSAGLGVLLSSQSPGDFDYKCRDNVRHWLVGRVQQDTAIAKMRPMLKEARTDIAAKLPALGAGQFFLVRDGQVESLQTRRSLIAAEQLADEEILALSRC